MASALAGTLAARQSNWTLFGAFVLAAITAASGGVLRDVIGALADSGSLGPALTGPAVGYGFVYHLEIGLLFAALVAIGPLARHGSTQPHSTPSKFGIAEFPT